MATLTDNEGRAVYIQPGQSTGKYGSTNRDSRKRAFFDFDGVFLYSKNSLSVEIQGASEVSDTNHSINVIFPYLHVKFRVGQWSFLLTSKSERELSHS